MAESATKTHGVESLKPIIVEAGTRSKKAIRRLKQGTGKLMREVHDIVEETREGSGTSAGSLLPIVIVYRQKQRRRRKGMLLPIPTPFDLLR